MTYLGAKNGLIPQDPDLAYRGQVVKELFELDLMKKYVYKPVWYVDPGPEQNELLLEIWHKHLPDFFKKLDSRLKMFPDDKFLCGNEVSIFDIFVAGTILNIFLNPKADRADGWSACMSESSSPAINQYISNFREVMKDYLQNRPQSKY